MAFDKLPTIVSSGRKGQPASVTLTCQGGGALPSFRIALSLAFATQAKIGDGEKFDLLIGTDEDQGVARLVRSKDGILTSVQGAKGGVTFFCGHIERFGTAGQKKQFCAAESLDADTVEITLPPWAAE